MNRLIVQTQIPWFFAAKLLRIFKTFLFIKRTLWIWAKLVIFKTLPPPVCE